MEHLKRLGMGVFMLAMVAVVLLLTAGPVLLAELTGNPQFYWGYVVTGLIIVYFAGDVMLYSFRQSVGYREKYGTYKPKV